MKERAKVSYISVEDLGGKIVSEAHVHAEEDHLYTFVEEMEYGNPFEQDIMMKRALKSVTEQAEDKKNELNRH